MNIASVHRAQGFSASSENCALWQLDGLSHMKTYFSESQSLKYNSAAKSDFDSTIGDQCKHCPIPSQHTTLMRTLELASGACWLLGTAFSPIIR